MSAGIEVVALWLTHGHQDEPDWVISKAPVGFRKAHRIVLKNDGNGPSGHFDRLHVHTADFGGRCLVFPAHAVAGWETK